MDRYDEKKHDSDGDDRRDTDQEPVRSGDILGLGGAPVPKEPGDPSAASDPESVARRKERVRAGEESERDQAVHRSAGATGIDMGAGGSGTDVAGE